MNKRELEIEIDGILMSDFGHFNDFCRKHNFFFVINEKENLEWVSDNSLTVVSDGCCTRNFGEIFGRFCCHHALIYNIGPITWNINISKSLKLLHTGDVSRNKLVRTTDVSRVLHWMPDERKLMWCKSNKNCILEISDFWSNHR